tara:strand:+ start:603 stop:773 length:171 start_codon:yes stop_codon:yes gene_type:complete
MVEYWAAEAEAEFREMREADVEGMVVAETEEREAKAIRAAVAVPREACGRVAADRD